MPPTIRINAKIDTFLAHRGFYLEDVRLLVRNQLYIVGLGLLGMVLSGMHPWAMALFAGIVLVSVNFWLLAKGLQGIVQAREGAIAVSLVRFYVRMILTGAILFGLIVWAGTPVPALLAGLSTVMISILCWGIFRFQRQKVKEA